MEAAPMPDEKDKGIVLTPEQLRARRARNIAIGLIVGLMVVLVYVLTIAKLGGHGAERGLGSWARTRTFRIAAAFARRLSPYWRSSC